MGLLIRMILYAVSAFISGYGFATFDGGAGTLTINLEQLSSIVGGAVTFLATFVAGRLGARWKGWRT